MKKLYFLICCTILLNACTVYKPDSYRVNQADYNQRVKVEDAHYDKVLTPVGVGSIVGTTAAGAFAGYQYGDKADLFTYYEEGQKKNHAWASGILGGAIGFTTSYLLNRAFGWHSTKRANDPQKWIRKANKKYRLLSSDGADYVLMHQNAEMNYKVKEMQDSRDYMTVFGDGGSGFENMAGQVASSSSANISRSDYLEATSLLSRSKYLPDYKKKYIRLSPSVRQMYSATDRFTAMGLDIPNLSSYLVEDFSDALLFQNKFKGHSLLKKVAMNSLQKAGSKSEAVRVSNAFKSNFDLYLTDFQKYRGGNTQKKNYSIALYQINNPRTIFKLEKFYHQYDWLKYNEKPNEIINNYWDVAYRSFSKGNDILGFVNNLANDKAYSGWNISHSMVNNIIAEKLKYEVKRYVSHTLYRIKDPNTPQWEQWVNNNNMTAGMVKMSNLSYLISGKVTNNSKFDLPLRLNIRGDIYRTTKIQGAIGTGLEIIEVLGEMFDDKHRRPELNESTTNIGSVSKNYYVPNLKKNASHTFAVVFDVAGSTGLNAFDWVKLTREVEVKNVTVSDKKYHNYTISDYDRKKQDSWLRFARQGMPEVKLIDRWRNKEYDNEKWKREYQEKLRQERLEAQRARERYAQDRRDEAYEASTLKKANFNWKWKGDWSGGGKLLWHNFPYNRDFLILKDGEEWAKGEIEKGKDANWFSVEFKITEYDSKLSGKEIDQTFYYNEDDNKLTAEGGWFTTDTKVSSEVKSFYSAISKSLNFTIDKLLDKIIESAE